MMLRMPVKLFPRSAARPYIVSDNLRAWATKDHVIIAFLTHSEDDYEWVEGEGALEPLLPLRDNLIAGDLRCLYIGWLAAIEFGEEVDENAVEPPVPPGLGRLSEELVEFANFLRVDPDLIETAARASGSTMPAGPSAADLAAWVAKLPESEKNELLVRAMDGEGTMVGAELLGRFRSEAAGTSKREVAPTASRRTVRELLAARETFAEEKRRLAAEKKAKDDARKARERAAARERHLESLVGTEDDLWQQVEAAVGTKLPKQYDHAIELLKDLRDLAARAGSGAAFATRVGELRQRHSAKSAFKKRLDNAGMPQ